MNDTHHQNHENITKILGRFFTDVQNIVGGADLIMRRSVKSNTRHNARALVRLHCALLVSAARGIHGELERQR